MTPKSPAPIDSAKVEDTGEPVAWKVVPVEPTDDMELEAENDYEQTGATFPDWKSAYRAMLGAAPVADLNRLSGVASQIVMTLLGGPSIDDYEYVLGMLKQVAAPRLPDANIEKVAQILACEIECGIFEQHVMPALDVVRKAQIAAPTILDNADVHAIENALTDALAKLIDVIRPGLDSGDIIADARTAGESLSANTQAECQYAKDIGMWPEHRCKAGHCEYDLGADDGESMRPVAKTFREWWLDRLANLHCDVEDWAHAEAAWNAALATVVIPDAGIDSAYQDWHRENYFGKIAEPKYIDIWRAACVWQAARDMPADHIAQAQDAELDANLTLIDCPYLTESPARRIWVEGYKVNDADACRYRKCREYAVKRGDFKTPEDYDAMVDESIDRMEVRFRKGHNYGKKMQPNGSFK